MNQAEGLAGLTEALLGRPVKKPKPPVYSVALKVNELGADWDCEVEFDIDGPSIEEDAVLVRTVSLNGTLVDFDQLSCRVQDEIVWAAQESLQ